MEDILRNFYWEPTEAPFIIVPNLRKFSIFMVQWEGTINSVYEWFIVRNPFIDPKDYLISFIDNPEEVSFVYSPPFGNVFPGAGRVFMVELLVRLGKLLLEGGSPKTLRIFVKSPYQAV